MNNEKTSLHNESKFQNDYVSDKIEHSLKHIVPLSFGEEVGNSVSHGAATIMFIFLLPFSAIYMYLNGGVWHAVGGSIYVITMLFMFLTSTIYHIMEPQSHHKYVMRIIDHSFIYLAIAGSYTPIAISVIGGKWGITVLIIQWAAVIFGILYKVLSKKVNPKVSLAFYLVMGWMVVPFLPMIITNSSWTFILLLVLGGLAYTVGAWFYAQKHRKYFHMIWHLFIVLAAVLQYIGIVFYIN